MPLKKKEPDIQYIQYILNICIVIKLLLFHNQHIYGAGDPDPVAVGEQPLHGLRAGLRDDGAPQHVRAQTRRYGVVLRSIFAPPPPPSLP